MRLPIRLTLVTLTLASCAVLSSGCMNLVTKLSNLSGKICDPAASLNHSAQQPVTISVKKAVLQHTKLSPASLKEACNDGARYSCMKKVFSPDASNMNVAAVECSHVDGIGSPCLNVNAIHFSTKDAAARAPAEAVEPGGIYNYVEYSCFNQAATDGKVFPAAGVQLDSLDKALDAAREKCLALSEENG